MIVPPSQRTRDSGAPLVPDWGTSCGGQRRRRNDHKPRLETVSLVVLLTGVLGYLSGPLALD
jgi:hypothetical protein